jgi:hypothetical protein
MNSIKPGRIFVIFLNQMFGSSQKSIEQKPLKNCLSRFMYINVCLYGYVYTPVEADVPKLSRVHMGYVRPKINNAAVVY